MTSTTTTTYHPFSPLTKKLTFTTTKSIFVLLLITFSFLLLYLFPSHLLNHPPISTISGQKPTKQSIQSIHCNYTDGKWRPNKTNPPYNNYYSNCTTIKPGQNCLSNGRPDTGYLRWRWHPTGCSLPLFSPETFLRLLTNKHLAFVGDSMARNQAESLLCLLAAAYPPQLVFRGGEDNKFRRWVFGSHNASVSIFWSPFLVEGVEKSDQLGLDHNKLYLDVVDKKWAAAAEMAAIDIVVLSAGHWFLHPAVFFEEGGVVGCHHCPELNHTEIGFFGVYRKAVRTAVAAVVEKKRDKFVVVTTFSPSHFEGEWDKAGACDRKEPYFEGEKEMEYVDSEMWRVGVEEVEAAAKRAGGGRGGVGIEVLDVTRMAMMRPDGHPGPYMNPNPFAGGPKERVQNDCVHWCLPGPIDAWNEVLLEMIRRRYSS